MHSLDESKIKLVSGEDYFNFGFGGASIPEIQEIFDYTVRNTKVKKLFIGLNFNLYNIFNNRDIASKTIHSLDNPFSYLLNMNVFESAFYIISGLFSSNQITTGNPGRTKEEFWRYQLSTGIRNYYTSYEYPKQYLNRLNNIAYYCRQNKIELSFIIFPTHEQLQTKVSEYKLSEWYQKFKADVRSLAKTYDFDTPLSYNKDSSNFNDPFHFNKEYGERIICIIWESARKIIGRWKLTTPVAYDKDKNIIPSYYTFSKHKLTIESGIPEKQNYSKLETVMIIKSDNGKQLKLELRDPSKSIQYDITATPGGNTLELINSDNKISILEKVTE